MIGRFMASVALSALLCAPTLSLAEETPPEVTDPASATETDGSSLETPTESEQPTEDAGAPPPVPSSVTPPTDTQAARTAAVASRILTQTSTVIQGEAGRVVQTYGASIPTLVCKVQNLCIIELERGEMVADNVGQGDTLLWHIEMRARSDSAGNPYQQFFFVKPDENAVESTFAFVTDRRVYSIQLVPSDTIHTPILAFDYPDTRLRETNERAAAERQAAAARASAAAAQRREAVRTRGVDTSNGAVPAEELTFFTSITGRADFTPERVYTDGSKTYIQLPQGYRGEVPTPIISGGNNNQTYNVNYDAAKRMMIIDRVVSDLRLSVGNDTVRVRR